MSKEIQGTLAIIRRKQVEARTGLSRSSIYAGIAAGTFPHPVSIGEKSVGWLEHEIEAWIASRIAIRSIKSACSNRIMACGVAP